ncbi:hypothetical protein BXY85_3201 [Roseivirga pacifica]|uniref:YceI-like domain-containing protein n=1 Tax=Roseivirga pacifica TaxID=1267423 RepID=A0A1I0QTS6_9BACT|nr:hypothetical protein [Roseivirga pacifica]RKQ42590.1 hypothetical protein BXY85_3201 [Roseivirga pacifica]SEW30680.1 hypothetical protein SAMN05216290_2674 [Roseivirga pacifica]
MTFKHTITLLLLISSLALKGQESFELVRKSVFIDGSTSIGRFSCVYQMDSITQVSVGKNPEVDVFGFQLPVKEFSCGNRMLNKDFVKTLRGDEYPNIEVVVEDFYKQGIGYAGDIRLTLIAQDHQIEALPFELNIIEGDTDYLEGTFLIDLNELEISPPKKLFGLIKVRNELKVKLRLEISG